MMTEWEVIEENEELKAEFRGYKEGMVRLKEGGWAMLPSTAAMIDTYKVQQQQSLPPSHIEVTNNGWQFADNGSET